MKWQRRSFYAGEQGERYQEISGKFKIDVTKSKRQGLPGSNMVTVIDSAYGGYALGSPRFFPDKSSTDQFIRDAKANLSKNRGGRRIPFDL